MNNVHDNRSSYSIPSTIVTECEEKRMDNRKANLYIAWQYDHDRIKRKLKEFYRFTSSTSSRRENLPYTNPGFTYPTYSDDLSLGAAGSIDGDWENLEDDDFHGEGSNDNLSTCSSHVTNKESSLQISRTKKLSKNSDQFQPTKRLQKTAIMFPSHSLSDDTSHSHSYSHRSHIHRRKRGAYSPSVHSSVTGKITTKTSFSTVEEDDWSLYTPVTGYSGSSVSGSIHDLKVKKRYMERSFDKRYGKFPALVELAPRKKRDVVSVRKLPEQTV